MSDSSSLNPPCNHSCNYLKKVDGDEVIVCALCEVERLTAERDQILARAEQHRKGELALISRLARNDAERDRLAAELKRWTGVDAASGIDRLAKENARLLAALERAYGIWSRFQGEHCTAADEMADVINAALNIGQEIGHAKRTADEHTQSRISENHTGSRIAQPDETDAGCNHDGYRKCWKCGKSLVIDCHECGAAQNGSEQRS